MPVPPDSAPGGGGAARRTGEPGRFDRQERFAPLGREGQARLQGARALLVGCGATGGVLAQTLVRAGIGTLILCDRDVVERSNLPRQVLFEQRHADEGLPKALAAAETLARIGGPTRVEPVVAQVDATNVEALAADATVVLDGTDNLPTRYLLNDWSVARGVPWVYAGAVGGAGLVLAVLPGVGPCLRCIFPEAPPPGTLPTCDTAGVVLPGVGAVASLAAGLGMRIAAAADRSGWPRPRLLEVDAWEGTTRALAAGPDPDCPCCARRTFPFLESSEAGGATVLCGRSTVQLSAPAQAPDLDRVGARLEGVVETLRTTAVFLRAETEGLRLTLFRDGRALVEGTEDPARARALYDRLVGR